jgi:hypothetical protein
MSKRFSSPPFSISWSPFPRKHSHYLHLHYLKGEKMWVRDSLFPCFQSSWSPSPRKHSRWYLKSEKIWVRDSLFPSVSISWSHSPRKHSRCYLFFSRRWIADKKVTLRRPIIGFINLAGKRSLIRKNIELIWQENLIFTKKQGSSIAPGYIRLYDFNNI